MKEENNEDEIEDDSWALYADASYGNSVIESDAKIEFEPKKEEEWFDGDDFEFEGSTINWDAPPCPAPLGIEHIIRICLLYTSPSPRDRTRSRMPSSA